MGKELGRRRARAEGARLVKVATAFLEAGRHADAIRPLSVAAGLLPKNAVVLNDLGVAHMNVGQITDAIRFLRRSIAIDPQIDYAHYNLARALNLAREDDAAIDSLRTALNISPNFFLAHALLGDILAANGWRQAAAESYEQASVASRATPLGRRCSAMAAFLGVDANTCYAERELRKLIASDPSDAAAHLQLAQVLQSSGRFDEAAENYERCISLSPWESDAYAGIVHSRLCAEPDRLWLTRILSNLHALGEQHTLPASVKEHHKMTLHFAAGKFLDDLAEYSDAMNHFDAANAVRRTLSPFRRREIEILVDQLIARFTPEFFAEHSFLGSQDETPILIVGMPRTGTTLMERILSCHHEIRGCGELDFWRERGPGLLAGGVGHFVREAKRVGDDYLHHLRNGRADIIRAVDKMPFNFFWIGFVHLLFPNALIFHAVRSPIDTCISNYTTPHGRGWGFTGRLSDLAAYYKLYNRLMNHWRGVIPRTRLIDVAYEDVVSHPEPTARGMIASCKLNWTDACLLPQSNSDVVRTASSWQARQPIYRRSVGRWHHYDRWIEELRALID
jgi:tetratricopeptide (TPR) repeat protein